jgi:hypothetical protein
MRKLTIPALCAAALLSGCATGTFTTRGSVTLACDKVLLSSQWGVLPAITTELDPRDAAPILKECKK